MKQTDFLHIIPSLDPKTGGPAAELQDLIPNLEVKGISNEIACLSLSGTKIKKAPKVPVHEFKPLESYYRSSPGLFIWGLRNLNRFRVIILHGLWQFPTICYLIWIVAICLLKRSFPKIYIKPHGMLDPWFQKSPTRRFKAIRNLFFWLFFEKWAVNSCNGLIFGCQKEMAQAKMSFPFYHPKTSRVIGYSLTPAPKKNWNSIHSFRKSLRLKDGQQYLLFISRIHPKKGLHLLIPAFAKLLKTYEVLPVLLMAGPGWESRYGTNIQKMAAESLPPESYRITGPLFGKKKWAAFHDCLAFVLPTQQENFGLVVTEALSCNKPVLISYSVNICGIINKMRAGRLFYATEESIFRAFTNLAKDSNFFSQKKLKALFKSYPLKCFKVLKGTDKSRQWKELISRKPI